MKQQAHIADSDTESIEVQSNEASSAPVTTRLGLEKVEVKHKLRDTEGALDIANIEDSVTITNSEVISWVSAWPTTNECTHFAAVLDPTTGQVMWTRQYVTPVDELHETNNSPVQESL
jgi:hypothetical protein